MAMLTKSIRLTEEEAAQFKRYAEATGEVEASVLKRAALRGLQDLRTEQGILAYLRGASSSEAAEIAGMGRAPFLQLLMDRGITILEGPSTLSSELEHLAAQFGSEKLARAARKLSTAETGE